MHVNKTCNNKFNSILPAYLHLLATPILFEALTRSLHETQGIKVGIKKNWSPCGCKLHDPTVISVKSIPACDKRTDGQTDRHANYS